MLARPCCHLLITKIMVNSCKNRKNRCAIPAPSRLVILIKRDRLVALTVPSQFC